jgi:integrase
MTELTVKPSPDIFGTKVGSKSCKLPSKEDTGTSPLCPQCSSKKVWRDGLRYISGGEVQRWLCRDCRLRFSTSSNQRTAVETIETVQSKELKSKETKDMTRQICAKGAKNLHVSHNKYAGTGEVTAEIRAAVTVFEGWMEKEGYKKNRYGSNILTLVRLGADLKNPEDVKAKIGAHKVRDGMKMMLCYSYEAYLKMNMLTWDRPEYKQDEIIPFIPEEGELDQLIAAAQSKRTAAYLQTLKETYTDPGEALPIEWKDVSGKLITIRHPVKNHRPRTLEVSDKLIAMINMVPHKSERIFDTSYTVMSNSYITLRKRIAARTKNDRIDYIELRSFRHWGGTKIAELSNGNPMTVMKMLGLKSIENAMKYVNIWKLSFRTETDYEFLAVTTPEELKVALLGGYEHVIEKFGASWFRRPKRIAIAGTPISQRPDQPQCPPLETPVNKQKPHIINAF